MLEGTGGEAMLRLMNTTYLEESDLTCTAIAAAQLSLKTTA